LFPGCSSHEELYNLSINQVKYLRALTTYYPLSEILQRSLMTIYLQTDLFWGTLARLRLRWNRDFQQVSDCNMETGSFRWFLGGQLNVSGKALIEENKSNESNDFLKSQLLVNCVDRHKEKDPSRVALIWEKDEPGQEERVTYGLEFNIITHFLVNKTLILIDS
jgi:acetyl-CoA synthetase